MEKQGSQGDLATYLRKQEDKSMLRFLTCGSVDDGKSTLIGRLLYDTKLLFEDQLAALATDSQKHGTNGEALDFAGLLADLEIPKVTAVRAAQLAAAFDAQALLDASAHNLVTAGLPSDSANALAAWLEDEANAGLLLRSAQAQAELRARLPERSEQAAGPLDGKTVVLTGTLSSMGRDEAKDKLEALGYELDDHAFQEAFKRFKDLADKKKHVFDDDIVALVDDGVMRGSDKILIRALRVSSGINVTPEAVLTLSVDGQDRTAKTTGDGPVDAIFNAIRELFPHEASLQLFEIKGVTEGTDAQAGASVRLEENGRTVTGRAADTDTVLAAANAYVNALNKLLVKREKRAPETLTVAR